MLKSGRCIAPADSFYSWKQVSKKGRIPHRVLQDDESLFSMAAVWEEFEDDEGHVVHTFRIITTLAATPLAELTPVVPFILSESDVNRWLDPNLELEEIESILDNPSGKRLRYYTVSPRIENPENDNPSLIKPFSPADQFGNYSLFD
ncbi:MAG: SOS response-associated peptidase family protein [Cyclobacteriaceae bacterium]